MSDLEVNTDAGIDTESNSGSDASTTVLEKESKTEERSSFMPGQLKWTASEAQSEPSTTSGSKEDIASSELTQHTSVERRVKWVWVTFLAGVFLTSFLIGYTVFGGQYWREVFDIHMWFHMLELLFS